MSATPDQVFSNNLLRLAFHKKYLYELAISFMYVNLVEKECYSLEGVPGEEVVGCVVTISTTGRFSAT